MNVARRATRWPAASDVLTAAPLLLAGCVTVYEDAPLFTKNAEPPALAVPQAIPIGAVDPGDRPMLEFYDGVVKRLRAAAKDRDLPELEHLLDEYERAGVPAWLQDRLAAYRDVARGMRFEQHAIATASLRCVDEHGDAAPAPPLGAPLRLELALPASTSAVRLGGRGDAEPCGFAVAITYEDNLVDGSTRRQSLRSVVPLARAFELAGAAVLRQPIEMDLGGGDAVKREVNVRIDLLPGYVRVDGKSTPVHGVAVAATVLVQWPDGSDVVRKAPLATLREAIRRGDAAHFRHVYLAACFAEGDDRQPAMELLIEQVRFGRADQAQVAMAALQAMDRSAPPIGDRQAWLSWWQTRR